MTIAGVFFLTTRIFEVVFTIPILGMLAWFVHGFTVANQLTPDFVLVMFIVSVLAAVWAIATLVTYFRARHNGLFVAFVDLCLVGAFIAGVYYLRLVTKTNCVNSDFTGNPYYLSLGPFGYLSGSTTGLNVNVNKTCAMLKASFALGIIDIFLFFWTFLLALFIHRNHRGEKERVVVKREYHSSRHGQRRSGSRDNRRSSRDDYRPSSGRRDQRRSSSRRPRQYYV